MSQSKLGRTFFDVPQQKNTKRSDSERSTSTQNNRTPFSKTTKRFAVFHTSSFFFNFFTAMKKYLAEMFGTMILVLMGCGAVTFFHCQTAAEILGVALAFGLSVVAMAYAIGGVSGCHINPAITLGVWLSRRMSGFDALMYVLFQTIGAVLGAALLWTLAQNTGFEFGGANGFHEPVTVGGAVLAEIVFTFVFVLVVLGATDEKKGAGSFAGLAIGLSLALVHIVCIPITGTSVNPARSIGPALFAGGEALSQLWVFIVAPLIGAALSALVWRIISGGKEEA